jgi:hypothetical protein
MKIFPNKVAIPFFSICYMPLLLFLSTCKKDKPETRYVDQETKDFAVFKPGSWWLYQNKKTNERDTWKLVSKKESIAMADETTPYNFEQISLIIQTKLNDSFEYLIEERSVMFITNKYFGLFQPAYFENGSNQIGSCDNNYIKVIRRDSFKNQCINREFGLYPGPCTTKFPIYTKWERNKGLTKLAYYNGDTLTLVGQKIEQ